MKRIVARNNLLDYFYLNKLLNTHTNDIEFQLGEVIAKEGKPITFYSRKLAGTPKRYTEI